MSYGSASLPMMYVGFDDAPWTVWSNKAPLFNLTEPKHTDHRSVLFDETNETSKTANSSPQRYQPQTNRYHAVWAKLDQKTRKVGAFSSWNN